MKTVFRASLLVLALATAARPAVGQETPASPVDPATDWRMPFRSPQSPLVPPEGMYEHLRTMYQIRRAAPPEAVTFDDRGIEVVDDPQWRAAREKLDQIGHDAGYLSVVLRDSRSAADRDVAFYGMFYVPDVSVVFQLIEHIPGEPIRSLREAAFRRAAPFVQAHLGRRNPGDLEQWQRLQVGPAGERPPKPGEYSHGFDPAPFHALLALEDPIDRRQALWFLARSVEARPELARTMLGPARDALDTMLADGDVPQREAVVDFLTAVDPDAEREPASVDDPEAVAAWLDAVVYDVFPPIRRISEGRFELWRSDDLDALVAAGNAALADGTLGATTAVRSANGGPQRGFRIAALPAPLDRLGLAVGDTLVAIDGLPVARAADLRRTLEARARPGRVVLVEFVDRDGRARAIDYVIH